MYNQRVPQRFRLLTEDHVRALLPPADLIQAMEAALARFSAGDVVQPVRSVLAVGPQKAFFGVMPAFVAEPPQLGAKLVTVFNGNLARGLPSHLATILLFDPGDRGARRGDGRALHHRGPHRRRLGGVGQGTGPRRRRHAWRSSAPASRPAVISTHSPRCGR